MSEKLFTILAYTENTPGVLQRITTSFTKRKVNIESLTVSETETKGISVFTIVVKLEDKIIHTVIKQLRRIIEVHRVFAFEDHEILNTEIAFIKVLTNKVEDRVKIEELAVRYDGRVASAEEDFMVIKAIGTNDDIEALYRLLEPFGIKEFVKSGRIAICKQSSGGLAA